MNKKNKTNKDHLSNLLSFMDANDEPSYDANQLLTEAGFNPDEVGKKFQNIANQSMAESPHNWRNRAHVAHKNAKEEYQKTKSVQKTKNSRTELIEAISALLSQHNLRVSFAHRNLTDQSDEDLESLLHQLEFIASQKSSHTEE
jgi:hypothetical protein